MTIARWSCLAVSLCVAGPALAETQTSFSIPALPLDQAVVRLGQQAGVSIGSNDPSIRFAIGHPVKGRMSLDRALRKLLDRTGFVFVMVDARTIRIVRAPPLAAKPAKPLRIPPKAPLPRAKPSNPSVPQPQPEANLEVPPSDIVVTASKQSQSLNSYAGTAHILEIGLQGMDAFEGTKALVDRLPTISGTNLGPGRNKLFIRGISDSSFTGPTQATVGLYLGDLRLTYNAPDPDLRLYDIEQIEVIEGPQGTLYGAGSLGGIVRFIPKPPTSDAIKVAAIAGVSSIKGGATGYDGAASLNLPIARDVLAIRVLGYQQLEGGYIDDPGQGLRNINKATIGGWRASLRLTPGADWTIDAGIVNQNINTRDSQYSERGMATLSRSARIRQPFDNNIAARYLSIMKHWDTVDFIAVSSRVRHDLTSIFDATSPLDPDNVLVFDEDEEVRMTNHEARLSGSFGGEGSWVLGINQVRNRDTVIRSMGPADDVVEFARLKNETSERAIFGEATYRIFGDISATLGARVVRATTAGEVIGLTNDEAEPARRSKRFLPTAALTWKPRANLIAFVRYQSGFRGGGIAVSGPAGDIATRFVPDKIQTVELGARSGDGDDRFSGSATLFYTDWRNIQADLLKPDGLPYTANIGRGRIYGMEANASWKPISGVTLDFGLFANSSKLFNPAPGFLNADARGLPNIAGFGARGGASYYGRATATTDFKIDANFHYVGRSRLGAVPPLIFEQGNYTDVGLTAALINEQWRFSLEATNLFDITGNSFAYGNPFSVAQGRQITPLRPRTIRLGVSFGF
jgi:iron complex outermembrane recepter protein